MSNVKKDNISRFHMLILSAAGTVSELGYAAEGAYAIPIILAAGIPLKYSSLVLSISPIIGIIIQSFVGSASDQCQCRLGKRRPFILLFGLMSVFCCATLPYYFYYKYQYSQYILPVSVISCLVVFNLSIGTLMIPARALMLDVIPKEQENVANMLTSSGVGFFTSLGFGFGAIKWTGIFTNEHSIEKQSEIVFGLTAGFFIAIILITVIFLKENSTISKSSRASESNLKSDSLQSISKYETVKSLTVDVSSINGPNSINHMSDNKSRGCISCRNPCSLLKDSLMDGVLFFYQMSHHMWILFLTFTMAFAAEFSFTYSFTIFVGQTVYNGDSKAPIGSDEYNHYYEGVRMGSLAFAIGCFVSIFISLALGMNFFVKLFQPKLLFLITVALFTCCTSLLMFFHQLPAVLVLGSILGPYMGICVAVPYGLVAVYVRHDLMFRSKWKNSHSDVVEGKAATVVNISILSGQIISTLIITPIADFMNDGNYFMLVPCVQAAFTFFLGCFLSTRDD